MALCKKCGQREQHTFPNGRTVALCSVCGWNTIVEFLELPDEGGLTPHAPDAATWQCKKCGWWHEEYRVECTNCETPRR